MAFGVKCTEETDDFRLSPGVKYEKEDRLSCFPYGIQYAGQIGEHRAKIPVWVKSGSKRVDPDLTQIEK